MLQFQLGTTQEPPIQKLWMQTACSLPDRWYKSQTDVYHIVLHVTDSRCAVVESAASVGPVIDWDPAVHDVSCCSLDCGRWGVFLLDLLMAMAQKRSLANTARDLVHSQHDYTVAFRGSEASEEHRLSLVKESGIPIGRYTIHTVMTAAKLLNEWKTNEWMFG